MRARYADGAVSILRQPLFSQEKLTKILGSCIIRERISLYSGEGEGIMDTGEKFVTCDEMKQIERAADQAGLSYYQMMENAGEGAFRHITSDVRTLQKTWIVFCGSGNNGGDGYVIARKAAQEGIKVLVVPVGQPKTEDAITNCRKLMERDYPAAVEFLTLDEMPESWRIVIVDAIFGTGFHGHPEGMALDAIHWINDRRGVSTICAIDVPSGLPGDEQDDRNYPNAIYADQTIVFHAPKPVHCNDGVDIRRHLGDVTICDIGINDVLK